jgi:hypothetical protein
MTKNRFNRIWISCVLAIGMIASGCASLNSVSMTQVPTDRSHPIEETVSNWAFLGIHFTNSFADEAIENLQKKCPNGRITGVYTKYEGYVYFLMTKRVVTAKAFCESKSAQQAYYDKKN